MATEETETQIPKITLRVTGGDPGVIEAILVDHPEVKDVEVVHQNDTAKAFKSFGEESGDD